MTYSGDVVQRSDSSPVNELQEISNLFTRRTTVEYIPG
jgi:hypothetical protein